MGSALRKGSTGQNRAVRISPTSRRVIIQAAPQVNQVTSQVARLSVHSLTVHSRPVLGNWEEIIVIKQPMPRLLRTLTD